MTALGATNNIHLVLITSKIVPPLGVTTAPATPKARDATATTTTTVVSTKLTDIRPEGY